MVTAVYSIPCIAIELPKRGFSAGRHWNHGVIQANDTHGNLPAKFCQVLLDQLFQNVADIGFLLNSQILELLVQILSDVDRQAPVIRWRDKRPFTGLCDP